MIITRTPFRVSFFGGGLDYPSWYNTNGGKVIGTTIDKYCYISIRDLPPFFKHKYRIVYSSIENVKTINEINHPSVREVLKYLNISNGLEIHHDGDLPARSGLGSSSSFTVGLINALRAYQGNFSSKEYLAKTAIDIEQNKIEECVGSQDQNHVAHGGLNLIEFTEKNFVVKPLILSESTREALENSCLLFFTGVCREAQTIAKEQVKNINKNHSHLHKMAEFTDEALSLLTCDDIKNFGLLLDENWKYKKSLASNISLDIIDNAIGLAKQNGAMSGKILGAGGGGFLLIFSEPCHHQKIIESLNHIVHVPFSFEHEGSKIIFYEQRGN